MPRLRLRLNKPLWLMLLMAAVIIAGWIGVMRYQAHSIDCATGAESCEEIRP